MLEVVPSKTRITIGFDSVLRVVLVLGSLWVIYLLRDIVLIILVAVVIASAIDPLSARLGRFGLPKVAAVLLIYVLTLGIFLGALPFLLFPIISQVMELSLILPERIGNLSGFFEIESPMLEVSGGMGNQVTFDDLLRTLQAGSAGVPRGFVQVASFVFGGFFSFILILVISFYLAAQKRGIEEFLRLITPYKQEFYVISLWQRTHRKIGYWLQTQLWLGVIVGLLTFIGLSILGVPYALALAVVAALLELIPFFGPIIAAVPALFFGFSDSFTLGLLVLVLYVIIQQLESHVIYPQMARKMFGVPPLVVIIAILVGAKLFGFLGIILAVPAATLLMEVANDWAKLKETEHQENV